jgi:FkbH-like protein
MRILITANFSTHFLTQSLRNSRYCEENNFYWIEADYGSVIQTLLGVTSNDQYDVAVVIIEGNNLKSQFYSISTESRLDFGQSEAKLLCDSISEAMKTGIKTTLLSTTYAYGSDVHGMNSPINPESFCFQASEFNRVVREWVSKCPNSALLDLSELISLKGLENSIDHKLRVLADHPWTMQFTSAVAGKVNQFLNVRHGRLQKCLVLDLDNTLWGGVIGDDGMEGICIGRTGEGKIFREIQLWCRELKNRGVILCVCSKNSYDVAIEPFLSHPEMILREEDIAVFIANWENKVDNIRQIQKVLNIGFDSMVFLDDNPAERAIVRENLPEVFVPELPEYPEDYLTFIWGLGLFETTSKAIVADTNDRNRQYQIEAKRVAEEKHSATLDEFLEGLQMKGLVSAFDDSDLNRIIELFQRSNQFNLTTKRYTEAEIQSLISSSSHHTFSFRLEDKFGNHGLIALVVTEVAENSLVIDNWVMSCRVLKRTMEDFILNHLVKYTHDLGFSSLFGKYEPSLKNKIVADLYPSLGFHGSGGLFELKIERFAVRKTHIEEV